ncbi:Rad9 [Macrophomina phaseolina MS6]|uniref:DNA repair protein rad9 n=1 Tax=Macrophomina phaseolina (strain MS6) TaxID=1126212 RepID=K2RC24_MACPH|nr:Rad9 [Macrophomina phaseolina MS6]
MVALNFTLHPQALASLHDALVCLGKFSESVSIEARRERLSLTALNSSKSAYASFVLDASKFFSDYRFASDADGRFTCRIYNKALLSVFKGRILDPKGKDTTVDRCEVTLQDNLDEAECRLIIKMLSNQGVTKTYKLTYESVEVMHALFDKRSANNRWTIHASTLKEAIEYFGHKTEQLDIYADDGRVTYTSFTEKISNGKEMLKQPLQTAVSLSAADFEHFDAAEQMHIIISVKDFKAIVTHADHLRASIHAYYSQPTRPLQFSYSNVDVGILCEFTLMTIGDPQGHVESGRSTPRVVTSRSNTASRAQSVTAQSTTSATGKPRNSAMLPPAAPISRPATRARRAPPGSATKPSQQERHAQDDGESLFVPQDNADDDARWDPAGYGDGDEEETLGWDASADHNAFTSTFRDSAATMTGTITRGALLDDAADSLGPTQRLSQIRGLW